MGVATALLSSVINFKTISLALLVYLIYKAYLLLIKIPLAFKAHFEAQGITSVPWIPLFGSILNLKNNNKADLPWKEMESRSDKHGRFYVNFFGPYPRLILNSPSHLQDMLVRKNNCYQKSNTLRLVLSPLLGNGLVTSEGALWRKQRTIINPAFHFGHLKQMISLMADCTHKALAKWPPATAGTDTIECHKEFSNLTLDIIASTAFGSSFRDNPTAAHTITHAFTRCLELIQERNFSLIGLLPIINQLPIESHTQLWNGVHAMQAVVLQILDDRQSAKSFSLCEGKDLLDLLVEARDEKGQPMPRDQMKDELMTFVLAGHETTSNLLTFMALKLSENPDILERCTREVDEVLPNLQTPTYETLKQLHYLDATLDETLRFHPPVAIINREAIEDNVLTGVDADGKPKDIEIKKGMTINVQIRMLHRDPLLWKDPLKFDPSRFLAQVQGGKTADSAEDVEALKPRYAPMQFLPFGGGPRSCIGSQFAKLEAKTIMASVLQRYSLELVPGQKLVDELAITVRPKYGLHVKLVPRQVPIAAQ